MATLVNTAEIRRRRMVAKLTLEEAARRAGFLGRQKWSDLERGVYPDPRVSRLVAAADALGCGVDDLLLPRDPAVARQKRS